jgi:hypothetical protein
MINVKVKPVWRVTNILLLFFVNSHNWIHMNGHRVFESEQVTEKYATNLTITIVIYYNWIGPISISGQQDKNQFGTKVTEL